MPDIENIGTTNQRYITAQITLQQSQVLPPLCWPNSQTKKITFHHFGEYGLCITNLVISQSVRDILLINTEDLTMFLGLLSISLLASKAGIILFIRSILVLLMGPGLTPIELTLQDLGIIAKTDLLTRHEKYIFYSGV